MTIHRLTVAGDPRSIGRALGEFAAESFREIILLSPLFAALRRWRGSERLAALEMRARSHVPDAVIELEALAEGAGVSFADAFLWNCRGDLLHATNDGCTTLAASTPHGALVAHNEDGDPALDGHCAILEAGPAGKPRFVSFVYPGSLPGHTFSFNAAGLVHTVNNLRLAPGDGVPRQLVARAVLDCPSLDAAAALLSQTPVAGGFHHLLADSGSGRIVTITRTPDGVSSMPVAGKLCQSNHVRAPDLSAIRQIVTQSSADRLKRGEALVAALPGQPGADDFIAILRDRNGPGLPIYRRASDDPDVENTIATVLFDLRDDPRMIVLPPDGSASIIVAVPRGQEEVDR